MKSAFSTPGRILAGRLVLMGGLASLTGCDRNTAPPVPTANVIEITRTDGNAAQGTSGAQSDQTGGVSRLPYARLPYGAAAPMAPGTDGVRPAIGQSARVAGVPVGLDQAPLPLDTPEAMVNNTPTGAGSSASLEAGSGTASGATAANNVALSATEMAFITQASEAGVFDLRIGQLGAERASHSAVRSYAAMLVTDQVALNAGLQQLSRQLGVPLPSSLSEPRQQILDRLARTATPDFDRHFVNAVGVRDHAATIELFERTGRETRHPLVKAFVLNTLPTLRAHLGVAQRLPIKG